MKITNIIAEIGQNYAYGNSISSFVNNVKKIVDVAKVAGCDFVKFQKKDPDVCVPNSQKSKTKYVPWRIGKTTYLQYKKDMEFNFHNWTEIANYCNNKGIRWFASVWDIPSVTFMNTVHDYYSDSFSMMKIPSALITDSDLCKAARDKADKLLISTGMSTEREIEQAVADANPDVIMHTNSTYPSKVSELNLDYISWLSEKYPSREIGYSGHEFGLTTTWAAVMLGATWIERHVTLDRTLWGSDQMASVEPHGLIKLVKGIRDIELSRGGYGEREVKGSETHKRKTLRR